MRRRRLTAAVATLALAIGAAACGSSSTSNQATPPGGSGSPSTQASGSHPSGPAGAPIVVGSIGSYSGPEAASLGATDATIRAWQDYTNATGGINGHPVKVITQDDQGNPALAAQLVKQLVEQDHIQALVGSTSTVTEAFQKYLLAKRVPIIGSAEFQQDYTTNPMFFATGTQAVMFDYGLLVEAKAAGVKSVGVLPCAEVAACSLGAKLIGGLSQIVGISVPYVQQITVSQPSYQAQCLAAKSKGVDGLVIVENAATVLNAANQCNQQGYKPRELNVSATTGQSWEHQPAMEGTITTQSNPVLADTSIPALQTFHQALAKYAPGVSTGPQYNEIDASVWAGGQAFKLAAKRAKLTPTSTPADVLRGLYTFKNETVGGLTPPLTYTPGKPAFVTCWFPQEIKNGGFASLTAGAKPHCIAPADLVKLEKLLAAVGA
jgi:branched-chain amino acid transport system substrate-binding protein